MKKIIRVTDEKRGILQITTSDERWYMKQGEDSVTGLPTFKAVPSATFISSYWPKGKGFEMWLGNKGNEEAQEIKEAAGEKGSVVHKAIEHINAGQEFRIDTKVPDYRKSTEQEPVERDLTYEEIVCVQSYLDWRRKMEQDYIVEILATERNVFSDMFEFAGTIDVIYRFTPKPEGKDPLKLGKATNFIVDYKTSKAIYRSHKIQLSAYHRTTVNGENEFPVLNPNGTETGKLHDLRICRIAILQLGYEKNQDGFKFTEIEPEFENFLVAQKILKAEIGDNKPGFTQREFPIVLSPAANAAPVDSAVPTPPPVEQETPAEPEKEKKSTSKKIK